MEGSGLFAGLGSYLARVVSPFLMARARAARAAGRYRDAALLYEEALRLHPSRARLQIQCGHMRKEAGEFNQAEAHYLAALRRLPDDPTLALELGHFYKISGRLAEAVAQYERAARLRPGWSPPVDELTGLRDSGWLGRTGERVGRPPEFAPGAPDPTAPAEPATGLSRQEIGRLAPALAPRRPDDLLIDYEERIHLRRFGRQESGFWDVRRTLRGLEAIHGFCISDDPVLLCVVIVNGFAIHSEPPKGDHPLRLARAPGRYRKYVFNIWLDFSAFAYGLHQVELRFVRASGEPLTVHEDVVIAPPVDEADYPASDALLSLTPGDERPIETQVRARPSIVRPAARALFPNGVRNILVMRTDQLGDMIASIPAMVRLREIAAGARIVGLLTAANADLARSLDLFDEVIVIDFPDDPVERRRIMPLAEQEALRRRLAPYAFDIALDLAQSDVSRDLLPLAGAAFVYGVGGGDWPWLTAEFTLNSHDRWSRMDIVPHSAKVLAMIEGLGALLKTSAPLIRRADLVRAMLEPYGIGPDDRYALLHMGARVEFSRWPHFPTLAALLLRHSDLRIVLMTDDPHVRTTIPDELLASDRVIFLDRRLPFDDFDAFVSFAAVLVGNDSGPKHLAALRGTNVVTLFTARINWAEWGQENVGTIISRKVPCQGCAIFHDSEDCGQNFTCITGIAAQEVFDTVMRSVAGDQPTGTIATARGEQSSSTGSP